jgi:hypothetical protein
MASSLESIMGAPYKPPAPIPLPKSIGMGGESQAVPIYDTSRLLTQAEIDAGWTVQYAQQGTEATAGAFDNSDTPQWIEGTAATPSTYYRLRPRPTDAGAFGGGYHLAGQHLDWLASGGETGDRWYNDNALTDILTAPVRQVGSVVQDVMRGENVGTTLRHDLSEISQPAINHAIDSWFGRAGNEVAGYGRRLSDITGRNVQGIGDAVESQSQGDISAGFREADDSNREAWRSPEVAIPASVLAAYFGQTWLGPYLAGGAAAAGAGGASGAIGGAAAGAAVGAGTAAAMGDSNLTDPAIRGGVAGGLNAGLSGVDAFGSEYPVANAAVRGGISSGASSAAAGDSGDQIGRNAVIGGASSAAGQYVGGEYGRPAGQFAGGATNLSLRKLWEDPGAIDMSAYYQDIVNQYTGWNDQYEMQSAGDGSGAGWAELEQTPEGQALMALFEEQKKDPAAKGAIGGAGQYGAGSDQVKDEFTGEYLA